MQCEKRTPDKIICEQTLSVLFEQGAAKKNIFAAQIKQRLGSFRACGRDSGLCPKSPVAFFKKRRKNFHPVEVVCWGGGERNFHPVLVLSTKQGLSLSRQPHFFVFLFPANYSAVRPERSIPSTRYLCPNRYRMISGAIMHKPQVFRIAA